MLYREMVAVLELENLNYFEIIEALKTLINYHKAQTKIYKEITTDIPHDDYYYACLHEYNFHSWMYTISVKLMSTLIC